VNTSTVRIHWDVFHQLFIVCLSIVSRSTVWDEHRNWRTCSLIATVKASLFDSLVTAKFLLLVMEALGEEFPYRSKASTLRQLSTCSSFPNQLDFSNLIPTNIHQSMLLIVINSCNDYPLVLDSRLHFPYWMLSTLVGRPSWLEEPMLVRETRRLNSVEWLVSTSHHLISTNLTKRLRDLRHLLSEFAKLGTRRGWALFGSKPSY